MDSGEIGSIEFNRDGEREPTLRLRSEADVREMSVIEIDRNGLKCEPFVVKCEPKEVVCSGMCNGRYLEGSQYLEGSKHPAYEWLTCWLVLLT